MPSVSSSRVHRCLRLYPAVFQKLQSTSVLLTVAMLLLQAAFPGVGCACVRGMATCNSTDNATCHCSESSPQTCSHCNSQSDKQSSEGGLDQDLGCHCGDFVPVAPTVPESSESTLIVLDLMANATMALTEKVYSSSTPALPVVLSSEELRHNFKQIVLCVWLT